MNQELVLAMNLLEKEKGIPKEYLLDALEQALVSAYKKNYGTNQNVRVAIDSELGTVEVYSQKEVVEAVTDTMLHISLEEALRYSDYAEIGDVLEFPITPRDFGRIAAQNAKQVIVQKIREAERNNIFEEYYNKEHDLVIGTVQRQSRGEVIVDMGKTEGLLPEKEQVYGEKYTFGKRMRFYLTEVKQSTKGPQLRLSRSHPGLVKRLFELEVPEIRDGVVELKSVSREAGSRSKIAVFSKDEDVDPVGACVGQRGSRVQAVTDELGNEKIDIIKWSSLPDEFIASSLSPSQVVRVDINEEEKSARVIVPDFQLSLAIGKDGQNARLAARLTGWKIDIKSESQFMSELNAAIEVDDIQDDVNEYEDETEENVVEETVDEIGSDETELMDSEDEN